MLIECYQMYTSPLQRMIMRVISARAKIATTPIMQKQIIAEMKESGIPEPTIRAAVRILVDRGFIRKAVSMTSRASYVQIRSLS